MENYYIYPDKNIFLLAFLKNTNILIGTLGIRSYDKDYDILKEFTILKVLQAFGELL